MTTTIRLGDHQGIYGEVALTPEGLQYSGDEPDLLRQIVATMRRPGQNDADLLADLPERLRSAYCWAVPVTP
jgi:hypothetical protein